MLHVAFELVKVSNRPFVVTPMLIAPHPQVRRQLEYSIAASKGLRLAKAPSTMEAVRDIFRSNGLLGLYTGFPLHFGTHTAARDGSARSPPAQ